MGGGAHPDDIDGEGIFDVEYPLCDNGSEMEEESKRKEQVTQVLQKDWKRITTGDNFPQPVHMEPSTVIRIPSEIEFMQAKKRLAAQLSLFRVVEFLVPGDGACQFASVSDQLYNTFKHTAELRKVAVRQLRVKPEFYIEFVHGETSYNAYCEKMSQPSSWGDNLTLQALSDARQISINLITSYEHKPHIEILPRGGVVKQTIWLSFCGEVHYNSLYPMERIEARKRLDVNSPHSRPGDCSLM